MKWKPIEINPLFQVSFPSFLSLFIFLFIIYLVCWPLAGNIIIILLLLTKEKVK
jgi:hypothetical protein